MLPGWALDIFGVYIDPERSDWESLLGNFEIWLYESKEYFNTEKEFDLLVRLWMYEEKIKERIYQSNSSVKIISPDNCSRKVRKLLS